ncbi:MAG: gliding motility-associated C-terminal domain-containing protein [Ferruginibacter sp.]
MIVKPVPVVTLVPQDSIIITGSSTTIRDVSLAATDSDFLWIPQASLNDPTIPDPIAVPSATTKYKLTVIAKGGCMAENDITITTLNKIDIPNVFSPGKNGPHSKWVIGNIEEYPNAEVSIFDRWGQLLFEQPDGYITQWDGTYNGQPLPVGTYYYVIKLNTDTKPVVGYVSIIR